MSLKIKELEGVTGDVASKLAGEGITSSNQLLKAAGQAKDRKELAKKLGIDERGLLELANRSDLGRLKGVGKVYSDLLEFAGVDTVVELSKRVPANLHAKILDVASEHMVQRTPTADDVQAWVAQAKTMDRAVHY